MDDLRLRSNWSVRSKLLDHRLDYCVVFCRPRVPEEVQRPRVSGPTGPGAARDAAAEILCLCCLQKGVSLVVVYL